MRQDLGDKLVEKKGGWKSVGCLALMLSIVLIVASCTAGAPAAPTETPVAPTMTATSEARIPVYGRGPRSYELPTEDGAWIPPVFHAGEMPAGTGTIRIQDIGAFTFDASQVETVRPDIFQTGHFSLFDALVHVAEKGDLALEYHFDETLNTHVIDSINGQDGWWYRAQYSGGWTEDNVFRMDMYPYKNGTRIWLYIEREGRLATRYRTFQEEVERLASNGGQVILPEVIIRSPAGTYIFQDVVVTAHDVRSDMLQTGVVTALDALLSLAEQGELSRLKLTWYERLGTADLVETYYVERIDDAEARGSCGFVYQTGPRGVAGVHIHIPSDIRVTVSPEYALWWWICI